MKYIILYGSLWQVPKQKFQWILEKIINNEQFYMENYGELLTENPIDLSLMTKETAKELYDKRTN